MRLLPRQPLSMNGANPKLSEPRRGRGRKLVLRLVMRIVMPLAMLSFGAYTVANNGYEGLVALLPVLGAHVAGFAVVYPLWVRYRRGRAQRLTAPAANIDNGPAPNTVTSSHAQRR